MSKRKPIANADWTVVGCNRNGEPSYTVTSLNRQEAQHWANDLARRGWDAHIYEPKLKKIIKAKKKEQA